MSKPFSRKVVRLGSKMENSDNLQTLQGIAIQYWEHCERVILSPTIIILPLLICSLAGHSQAQASQEFFSLQMNSGTISQQPWPCVSFGGMRLWDSQVHWRDINTATGVYDWTLLEEWLADAQLYSVNVLYTFGEVPQWASSKPNDRSCSGGPGACDPPNDLNEDGSGSDQHWKDFVSALVSYNQNSTTGHIRYWELWNEALGNPKRWTGTIAQLIRLAQDATAIIKAADSSAVVLNPTFGAQLRTSRDMLDQYLAAGGGQYMDAVAFHGYVTKKGSAGIPEDLVRNMDLSEVVLKKYGQGNKPLWDTEASWGDTLKNKFTDADLQAAFLARFYLLHWSVGVARFYWYEWNNQTDGALWVPDPHDPSLPGKLLKPGIAYAHLYDWIVGATLSSACTAQGAVWTCKMSRDGGYQAEAIWDTAKTCKHGRCTTIKYTVPSKYTQYRTLSGKTIPITGSKVPIGIKPILVEN
jgi:hypothetical protein